MNDVDYYKLIKKSGRGLGWHRQNHSAVLIVLLSYDRILRICAQKYACHLIACILPFFCIYIKKGFALFLPV